MRRRQQLVSFVVVVVVVIVAASACVATHPDREKKRAGSLGKSSQVTALTLATTMSDTKLARGETDSNRMEAMMEQLTVDRKAFEELLSAAEGTTTEGARVPTGQSDDQQQEDVPDGVQSVWDIIGRWWKNTKEAWDESVDSVAIDHKGGWLLRLGEVNVDRLDPWQEKAMKGSASGGGAWSRSRVHSRTSMPKHGTWDQQPQTFILHTTESGPYGHAGATRTLDRYGYWPHFIACYHKINGTKQLRIGQFLSINEPGRALAAFNRVGAIQIEICGYAKYPFTDDPKMTAAVGKLWRALWVMTKGGIPLSIDKRIKFGGSSKAYGHQAAVRIKNATAWRSVTGLAGHQHVPRNKHWDPGAITASRVLVQAKSSKPLRK